jgi:hypothetical protein
LISIPLPGSAFDTERNRGGGSDYDPLRASTGGVGDRYLESPGQLAVVVRGAFCDPQAANILDTP